MTTNEQIAAEVMTVIILGSATFLSVYPGRSAEASRRPASVRVTVEVSPELPQDQVRDFTFGS
jgi:hypothetical protein